MRLLFAVLSSSVLFAGCGGLFGLSRAEGPNEGAEALMCQEMSRLFPAGKQVDVQAGRGGEALNVTGRVREWREADRQLVLEDCVVHAKGTARTSPGFRREYAVVERINVDAETGAATIVADVTIPVKGIHHMGPLDCFPFAQGAPKR
jgi:hypothetical protein